MTLTQGPRSRSQWTYTQNHCLGHNSSLLYWIWIMFHTVVVHDPSVCRATDPRSYLPRSMLQCTHTLNPYLVHNSLLSSLVLIIFQTIVCHDSKTWHDLEPRSYILGQVHSTHMTKLLVRPINPYCHVGSWCFLSQFYSGHELPSSISQFIHCKKCPAQSLSRVTWMGMILHWIVAHVLTQWLLLRGVFVTSGHV